MGTPKNDLGFKNLVAMTGISGRAPTAGYVHVSFETPSSGG
jgi:hypothetical protein